MEVLSCYHAARYPQPTDSQQLRKQQAALRDTEKCVSTVRYTDTDKCHRRSAIPLGYHILAVPLLIPNLVGMIAAFLSQ